MLDQTDTLSTPTQPNAVTPQPMPSAPAPAQAPAQSAQSSAPAQQTPAPQPNQPQLVSRADVQNPTIKQPVDNSAPEALSSAVSSIKPEQHPLANRIRGTAEALAGGPAWKQTINADGSRTVERVPLSRRDVGMAIALEAISGALSGLQARGPGHLGQAGALGFQRGQQLAQQRQQGQQQSIDTQTADLARRAAVTEANYRMLNNAIQIGRLQREDHEQMVSSYADTLDEWQQNAPELIKDQHVSEADAKDIQKYNLADYLRLPDGTVPRIGSDGQQAYLNGVAQWDNTYTIVDKSAKTQVTDEDGQPAQWVKDAVSWNLPGWPSAWLRVAPSQGATVPAATALRAIHQTTMLNATQSELNSFSASFGTNKDGSPKTQPVDLKAAIQKDPTLLKAVQQFQRVAGMSTQPDRQLDAMRQNPKLAPFAGKIMALFGPDALENYKTNREAREAAAKTSAEAQARLQVEDSPEAIAAAAKKAAAEAKAKAPFENERGGVVSEDDANAIADAIRTGKQPPVIKNLYRNTAAIQAALARKGYDLSRAQTDWTATQKRLATMNGPQQVRLQQAVEFTSESLPLLKQKYEDWKQAAGVSGFKVFNRATLSTTKNLPGKAGAAAQALATQIADITSELGTVYKGGNSSTDESLALAAKNFSADWNEQTFDRAYDLVEQNLRIRRNSIQLSVNPIGVSDNSPYPPSGPSAGSGLTNIQVNPQTKQQIGWDGQQWVDVTTRQAVK